MIRKVIVHILFENTLLCLCLLSITAKGRIPGKWWPTATNNGQPASSSGRQPPRVADRPAVEKLFKMFLCWGRSSLENGAMFRDQSQVQTEASKGKAVDLREEAN